MQNVLGPQHGTMEHRHAEVENDAVLSHKEGAEKGLASAVMTISETAVPPTRLDTQPHIFMQIYAEEETVVTRPSESVAGNEGTRKKTCPTPVHRVGGQQAAEVSREALVSDSVSRRVQ